MAKEPTFLPPRRKWVTIIRVSDKSPWGIHGPMTHDEAKKHKEKIVGTGMECHVALWTNKLPVLPHILLIGSVAYFKTGKDIFCVLSREPEGFPEFDLWEAVIWQPSDVDSVTLRDFIVEHFKLRS